jgi:trypsin
MNGNRLLGWWRATLRCLALTVVLAGACCVVAGEGVASAHRARYRWPVARGLVRRHGPHGRWSLREGSRSRQAAARLLRARSAIVSGHQISVTQSPWQVLVIAFLEEEGHVLLCGGSILGEARIVTAGHCLFDPKTGAQLPASDMLVVAGTSDFQQNEPSEEPSTVQAVRVHPGYNHAVGAGGPDDVAVLTLSKSLAYDTSVQPIGLAPANAGASEGEQVGLTGFGQQSVSSEPNGLLYSLGLTVGASEECGGEADAVFLCASSSEGSGCLGDSGSGLTAGAELVGVMDTVEVIADEPCRVGSGNGFVNVAAPEIRDFIEGAENPPVAPRGGGGVSIRAVTQVGESATCQPGEWSGSPTFTYTFLDSASNLVLQSGASQSYKIAKSDLGRRIACRVQASNEGGTGARRTTPLPAITASERYESEVSQWSTELIERQAKQAVREYEAKLAKEREEAEAREAAARAQLKAEEQESAEGEGPLAKAKPAHCVVPSLRGDSLSKARHVLKRAHCRLGAVTASHGHGRLVVVRQRAKPGKRLPNDSRVGVTLAPTASH